MNAGVISLQAKRNQTALTVGDGSRIENQASGKIQASEAPGASQPVAAVELLVDTSLVNAGTIEVVGNARGTAVVVNRSGSSVENSGTIDASRGGTAIRSSFALQITNSGTILGGAREAIRIANGAGSQVTLQQGSRVEGTVSVRASEVVPKTDAELGNDPAFIAFCQSNPTSGFCNKAIQVLPTQTTLGLEGTGTEDDRITGFNLIEKRDAGA